MDMYNACVVTTSKQGSTTSATCPFSLTSDSAFFLAIAHGSEKLGGHRQDYLGGKGLNVLA
jgi:hypothetical protein